MPLRSLRRHVDVPLRREMKMALVYIFIGPNPSNTRALSFTRVILGILPACPIRAMVYFLRFCVKSERSVVGEMVISVANGDLVQMAI